MESGADEEIRDGRVLRGARNREAIVQALFELIGAGERQPTAEQVAERAGVRVRTVFRHFDDMAGLNAELGKRVGAEVLALLGDLPEGSLEERVRGLVERRALAFERLAPYKRAADTQRWRRDFLQSDHEALVEELRRVNLAVLPELVDATPETRAACELLLSFEAWERLRTDQHLDVEGARAATRSATLALLAR